MADLLYGAGADLLPHVTVTAGSADQLAPEQLLEKIREVLWGFDKYDRDSAHEIVRELSVLLGIKK